MSDEELVEANQRLANPPMIDLALSRMMGLYVVGRLAQRYGIRVQLRHSWYGGVTALVLLPPGITIRPQVQESGAAPGIRRPELPPPRSNGQGGGGQPGEHLPIFEQARSDWFDEPDAAPPLRRPAQPLDASSGNGNGYGAAVVGGQSYDSDLEDFEASPPIEAETIHPAQPAEPIELLVEPEEPADQVELREPLFQPEPEAPQPPLQEPQAPQWEPEAARPEPPPAPPRYFTSPGAPLPRRQRPLRQHGPAPERQATPAAPVPEQPMAQPPLPEQPMAQALTPEQAAPQEAGGPRFTSDPEAQLAPQPPLRPPAQARSWQAAQPAQPLQQPAQPGAFRQGEDIAVPLPDPTLQRASVQTTKAGLPRRVPRANLAPGIVAEAKRAAEQPASTPPASSFSRSPDEVRSMLSSYRTGLERGRRMAAGNDLNDRGEDARSGYGGPNPMAPRSDDDAAQ
jgi:hypothetical protein